MSWSNKLLCASDLSFPHFILTWVGQMYNTPPPATTYLQGCLYWCVELQQLVTQDNATEPSSGKPVQWINFQHVLCFFLEKHLPHWPQDQHHQNTQHINCSFPLFVYFHALCSNECWLVHHQHWQTNPCWTCCVYVLLKVNNGERTEREQSKTQEEEKKVRLPSAVHQPPTCTPCTISTIISTIICTVPIFLLFLLFLLAQWCSFLLCFSFTLVFLCTFLRHKHLWLE